MSQHSTNIRTTAAQKFEAVPLLDLQRQYQGLREEILAAVTRVCDSQQFILGREVEALESEIGAFCGAPHAVACASGTDALWLALVAAGVRPGDAVVTPPFSFFASASVIVRAGARPIFADIGPRSFNIDPKQVADRLKARRRDKIYALLPVHLYGQCADMTALAEVAKEFQLTVIEDAAQAIGAEWDGRRAGSLGVAAAFSFYPTKNLSAYGDAGIVTTQDSQMAEHVRRLRNHGSPQRYLHEEFGWNARMDAIQAAVLRVKLPHVEEWNRQRRARAAAYGRLFSDAGLAASAGNSPAARSTADFPIVLPEAHASAHHVFHQYVVRTRKRDDLRKFLAERKIGSEVYYPIPLHLQPCFNYLGHLEGDFPESERAAREVLAIPMFPELTEAEQAWVVESIAEFYSP